LTADVVNYCTGTVIEGAASLTSLIIQMSICHNIGADNIHDYEAKPKHNEKNKIICISVILVHIRNPILYPKLTRLYMERKMKLTRKYKG
jgi:hypothetical protein